MNSAAYESYCKFISSLFHEQDTVCFAVFTRETKTHVFLPFEQVLSTDHFKKLEESNNAGADIYFGLNPFDSSLVGQSQGRTEANISRVARLYVDIDANGSETLARIKSGDRIPQPHSILSTSPNKYQLIWNVSGMDKETAKQHLAALIQHFGTDTACKDLNRIFRLPGFKNHKYSDKPIVQLLEVSAAPREFSIEDFKLPLEEARTFEAPTLPPDVEIIEIRRRADLVRSNLKQVGTAYSETTQSHPTPATRFEINCPWSAEHNPPNSKAAIFAYADGFGFHCFHQHCSHRTWQTFRSYIDGLARERGVSLSWGSNPDAVIAPSTGELSEEIARLSQKFPTYDGVVPTVPPALVTGLLAIGTNMISALPEIGKSWLAMQIARDIVVGRDVFGIFEVPEPVAVLYLCPEEDAVSFKIRLAKLGFPTSSPLFRYRTISEGEQLSLQHPDTLSMINLLREGGRRRVLVIVDTLIEFFTGSDINSASQNNLRKDCNAIRALGASVLLLHHATKDFEKVKLGGATLQNSSAFTGDFGAMIDCGYALQRDQGLFKQGVEEILVTSTKSRKIHPRPKSFRIAFTRKPKPGENGEKPVSFIDTNGSLQYIGPDSQQQSNSVEARLDELLMKHPEWTRDNCASHLGFGLNKFDRFRKAAGWERGKKNIYDENGNLKLNAHGEPLQKSMWVKPGVSDFVVESLDEVAANVR